MNTTTRFWLAWLVAIALSTCVTVGPGEDAGEGDAGPADAGVPQLAIIGSYVDNWNMEHIITQTEWTDPGDPSDSVFHISQFSNADRYIIAQNDPANPYTVANQWSRFDWTYDTASTLHFCQITYAAATESAALATTSANRSDLAAGCNGFGWSSLTPQ